MEQEASSSSSSSGDYNGSQQDLADNKRGSVPIGTQGSAATPDIEMDLLRKSQTSVNAHNKSQNITAGDKSNGLDSLGNQKEGSASNNAGSDDNITPSKSHKGSSFSKRGTPMIP